MFPCNAGLQRNSSAAPAASKALAGGERSARREADRELGGLVGQAAHAHEVGLGDQAQTRVEAAPQAGLRPAAEAHERRRAGAIGRDTLRVEALPKHRDPGTSPELEREPGDVPGAVDVAAEIVGRNIGREQGRLDVLVNDISEGEVHEGKPFWKLSLEKGFRALRQGIHAHIITNRHLVPLMIAKKRSSPGLVIEIGDGDTLDYRQNLFYDLVKVTVSRLAGEARRAAA